MPLLHQWLVLLFGSGGCDTMLLFGGTEMLMLCGGQLPEDEELEGTLELVGTMKKM